MEELASKNKKKWVVIILIIIVLVLVFSWYKGWLWSVGEGEYKAVFLANNQVYFGKLSRIGSDYPILRDVYYLRVTQVLQPSDQTPGQQIQLMKLGGEIHGPQDEMKINRSQILFIESLKGDSQIVKAIEANKKSQQR